MAPRTRNPSTLPPPDEWACWAVAKTMGVTRSACHGRDGLQAGQNSRWVSVPPDKVRAMTGFDPSEFLPDGMSVEEFARASLVDPDTVLPLHVHKNPVTGQSVTSGSWPCPQCVVLGRTEPLRYGVDVLDELATLMATEIPADRLEEYLATFPALPAPGGHRARRNARRAAERQARRGKH